MPAIFRLFSSGLLVLLLAAALLGLSGCGKQTVRPAPGGGYEAPAPVRTTQPGPAVQQETAPRGSKPYTVMGKTYYPLLSADNFREEGIASWYGKDFHGKQTANGERYDMYGLTAAHKLLPFGTMVRVTSKVNGKSVVVRVNDRGPFVDNRVIDLTYSGARDLDMLGSGTAPVIVETIGAVKGLHEGRLEGRFYVQVGAFSVEANASNLVRELRGRGYGARAVFAPAINFWRVQVGPYGDLSGAESAAQRLKGEYQHNFIVAD